MIEFVWMIVQDMFRSTSKMEGGKRMFATSLFSAKCFNAMTADLFLSERHSLSLAIEMTRQF